MTDSPITRATLLLRMRNNSDADAWNEFVQNYGPMLYRFVRSRGLQDSDAADVVQDVMRRVSNSIGKLDYDQEKGGFRAWLYTITRNRLYSHFEKQARTIKAGGDTQQMEMLNNSPEQNDQLQAAWEQEHQRHLASMAMEEVQHQVEPRTWQAFSLTAVEGHSAEKVAKQLGMTSGTVYVAKSRVIAKLRAVIERLQSEEDT